MSQNNHPRIQLTDMLFLAFMSLIVTRDDFPAAKISRDGSWKVFTMWIKSHFRNYRVSWRTFSRSRKRLLALFKKKLSWLLLKYLCISFRRLWVQYDQYFLSFSYFAENISLTVRDKREITSLSLTWKISAFC